MQYTLEIFKKDNPHLKQFAPVIETAALKIKEIYKNKGKILLCGNGGSASDCEHIAGEFMKSFIIPRPISDSLKAKLNKAGFGFISERLQDGICCIVLSSMTSLFTAVGNDIGYDVCFAQQVMACGEKGDVLFAISTSGNSQAVCNAAAVARAKGMYIIGLTGESGGKLKPVCDICFNVPAVETYKIQEMHLPIYHSICALAEEIIFGGNK